MLFQSVYIRAKSTSGGNASRPRACVRVHFAPTDHTFCSDVRHCACRLHPQEMAGSRTGARRRYRSDLRVGITANDMSDLGLCVNELPTGEECATISSQGVNAGLANELIKVLQNKKNGNLDSF